MLLIIQVAVININLPSMCVTQLPFYQSSHAIRVFNAVIQQESVNSMAHKARSSPLSVIVHLAN